MQGSMATTRSLYAGIPVRGDRETSLAEEARFSEKVNEAIQPFIEAISLRKRIAGTSDKEFYNPNYLDRVARFVGDSFYVATNPNYNRDPYLREVYTYALTSLIEEMQFGDLSDFTSYDVMNDAIYYLVQRTIADDHDLSEAVNNLAVGESISTDLFEVLRDGDKAYSVRLNVRSANKSVTGDWVEFLNPRKRRKKTDQEDDDERKRNSKIMRTVGAVGGILFISLAVYFAVSGGDKNPLNTDLPPLGPEEDHGDIPAILISPDSLDITSTPPAVTSTPDSKKHTRDLFRRKEVDTSITPPIIQPSQEEVEIPFSTETPQPPFVYAENNVDISGVRVLENTFENPFPFGIQDYNNKDDNSALSNFSLNFLEGLENSELRVAGGINKGGNPICFGDRFLSSTVYYSDSAENAPVLGDLLMSSKETLFIPQGIIDELERIGCTVFIRFTDPNSSLPEGISTIVFGFIPPSSQFDTRYIKDVIQNIKVVRKNQVVGWEIPTNIKLLTIGLVNNRDNGNDPTLYYDEAAGMFDEQITPFERNDGLLKIKPLR